jgi:hypothetical protein
MHQPSSGGGMLSGLMGTVVQGEQQQQLQQKVLN